MGLTVNNAEIHTATVEVKVLTISGKQLTLSVFRQIPKWNGRRIHVIDDVWYEEDDDEPITVLGYVNYFWGNSISSQSTGLHFVLAHHGLLYRKIMLFVNQNEKAWAEPYYDQLFIAV